MNYGNDGEGFVVRLRGLPWSVGKEEVASFLDGCNVQDVHFTFTRDGRPSGEAYVELVSENDVSAALEKNQQHMGKRYIEVFRSKRSEMEWVLQKDGNQHVQGNTDSVVRLRGLPFSCTHEDISSFFKGLQIVPNGIALLADDMGRASGEAYVQFASQSIADLALQKHKEKMGLRYVEIFKSSMMEAETAIATQGRYTPGMNRGIGPAAGGGMRASPYDRAGAARGARGARGVGAGMATRGRGNIKGLMGHNDGGYGTYGSYSGMAGGAAGGYGAGYGGDGYGAGMGGGAGYGAYGARGAGRMGGMRGGMGNGRGGYGGAAAKMSTFESTTGHSVHMRGLPYSATEADIIQFFSPLNPLLVVVGYNDDGRPSGEADVDFATHLDAEQAMKKHKAMMDRRYIELFLNSTSDAGGYNSFEVGGYGAGAAYGAY